VYSLNYYGTCVELSVCISGSYINL